MPAALTTAVRGLGERTVSGLLAVQREAEAARRPHHGCLIAEHGHLLRGQEELRVFHPAGECCGRQGAG